MQTAHTVQFRFRSKSYARMRAETWRIGVSVNTCWRVSDPCTLSDHCAIAWRVAKQRKSEKNKITGWKASAFDADAMRLCMDGGCTEESSAEEKVEDVMQKVTSACEAAMPRGNGNQHKLVY